MNPWCLGVCIVLALAGLPIGVRHAMFVRKGKFSAIDGSDWGSEGVTCLLFCIAVVIYLIDADHRHGLIGALTLVLTITYMVIATIFVTSTERCKNGCQRSCNCNTNLTPKPKTGWLLLAVLAMRYLTLAGLLIASML